MSSRSNLIVANWKMNQTKKEIQDFFTGLEGLSYNALQGRAWIAPQALHIPLVQKLAPNGLKVGAQNCAQKTEGAMTGEISPLALKDLGGEFVILGHSERRALFQESDELLNQKMHCALDQKLCVIFCVGETLEQREAEQTLEVIKKQLEQGLKNFPADHTAQLVVAYEPVWAIGTGKTASPEQAQEVHAAIRKMLQDGLSLDAQRIPLLYGGSVKAGNLKELLTQTDIDGGLVGGASLKPSDFKELCQIALT